MLEKGVKFFLFLHSTKPSRFLHLSRLKAYIVQSKKGLYIFVLRLYTWSMPNASQATQRPYSGRGCIIMYEYIKLSDPKGIPLHEVTSPFL